MFFNTLTSATLLLSAVSSVTAYEGYYPSKPHTPPAPPPAPTCTHGTTTLKTTIAYPYLSVLSIIGTFQKADWQGLPVIAKSGKPNAPGSTRTITNGVLTLTEKLTYSYVGKNFFEQKFYLSSGPITALGLDSYKEDLVVKEGCFGYASEVVWKVDFCATNVTAAAEVFESVHVGGIATVVKDLGGKKYKSCKKLCKVNNNCGQPYYV